MFKNLEPLVIPTSGRILGIILSEQALKKLYYLPLR